MRILFIGDIVGRPGREIIQNVLWSVREREKIDMVIANGENAAGGSGLTPEIAEKFFRDGIDVLTSGDHIWKKKEIYGFLEKTERVIRPLNYPKGVPGKGATVIETAKGGVKVGIINLIGRVFMSPMDCPFERVGQVLEELKGRTSIIIVDMHAEATSEKIAMGWYLNGAVSAVLGTHTHIQTADEKILSEGTAYITDCGMTGPYDSVIGRNKQEILTRFLTQMPVRFEMATDDVEMHGVIIEVDVKTGKALNIRRIKETDPNRGF